VTGVPHRALYHELLTLPSGCLVFRVGTGRIFNFMDLVQAAKQRARIS
jgi:hypothetical protein